MNAAWFHGSCRVNDNTDDGHGNCAAKYARTQRGVLFQLDDHHFELLLEALRDHTNGKVSIDATIGTC